MSFLAPAALAFAALLPLVVVFYLLKRKRVFHRVPSTLLWQRFLAENQASAPFQKLRRNTLLLLQLILMALVVVGLARPYFAGTVRRTGLQVVILDASASMQATDVSPNRFEQARSKALELVDALGVGEADEMAILLAGAQVEVRQSRTGSKPALRRAVEGARVTDSPTRLVEALRVAESLTRGNPLAEVHLVSDGAVSDLDAFEASDLRLVYHRMGQRSENAGIVRMEVKANPEDPSQRAVFVGVTQFGSRPLEARLDLSFNGTLVESRIVRVDPGQTLPEVFLVDQGDDGVFRAQLAVDDDLAVDNVAHAVSSLPPPVRIELRTRGNRFLERALAAAGSRVELEVVEDARGLAAETSADIVVLDGILPPTLPSSHLLVFGVVPPGWFEGPVERLESPAIVDWRSTHPVMRFVGMDNVQISATHAPLECRWALPLVETARASIVVAGERDRRRVVWVGFDPLESTWPLRIGFPIFVANSVEWLHPATAQDDVRQIRPGDPIRLSREGEGSALEEWVEVRWPDGSTRRVPWPEGTRELVIGGTTLQGVYQVVAGSRQWTFAASLVDVEESRIEPRDILRVGRFTEVAAEQERRASVESWRWFVLAGLVFLMGEWWWYHRRTA